MLIFQALPFPAPVTRARFPAKEISMYPEINNESTNFCGLYGAEPAEQTIVAAGLGFTTPSSRYSIS